MKVLHTISGLNINAGGPSQSVFHTVKGLRQYGIDASILTFQSKRMISADTFITALPANCTRLSFSLEYKKQVECFDGDIFHAHGLWQYPTHITSVTAHRRNTSVIISPRGMLNPHALNYSKWIKKAFLQLWFNKDLNSVTCMHVTCKQELVHIYNFGLRCPVAIIPNPLVISDVAHIKKTPKKQIGFVGRLHAIKNIETLINAFNHAKTGEYELVIIGDGKADYVQYLKNISKKNIKFTGFIEGITKDNIMSDLSYLVLPSHSENFGMVVPEALIKGVPVIASKGTPWEELNTHHCGWWVDNDVDTLAETIETAISTPESTRFEMGKNGQKLVMENYSVKVVANKMIQLYNWVINGGVKPDFIYV